MFEVEQVECMMKWFQKGCFNMNDLKMQLEQMLKMGGMESLMGMLFGVVKYVSKIKDVGFDDCMLCQQIVLINFMIKKECVNFDLMQVSCKKCVVKGVGMEVLDFNKLLKQ